MGDIGHGLCCRPWQSTAGSGATRVLSTSWPTLGTLGLFFFETSTGGSVVGAGVGTTTVAARQWQQRWPLAQCDGGGHGRSSQRHGSGSSLALTAAEAQQQRWPRGGGGGSAAAGRRWQWAERQQGGGGSGVVGQWQR
jgi:hypothetical protein